MTDTEESPQSYWFVGTTYGETEDQMPRFLNEGIWENGYDDKHLDVVRSMRPGDRIAIKSSYTRKHELPFDSRGNAVSVMAIKATGTITGNANDGKRVRVDWKRLEPPREWYFYTHRGTIWRIMPGEWMSDGLLAYPSGTNLKISADFAMHLIGAKGSGLALSHPLIFSLVISMP
jgi:5-methylcytosine-specific restriction protein B